MHQSTEKIQFFHSQSSFGSQSSLQNSRYYDFTNQILTEAENIFLTLQKQLLPNQSILQTEKVLFLISRASLLIKNTIPDHLVFLSKVSGSSGLTDQIQKCQAKLLKLINDYQLSKNGGTVIFKQFYNRYGREYGYKVSVDAFSKKNLSLIVQNQEKLQLKPEYIEINYNAGNLKLKSTPRVFAQPDLQEKDKESNFLRDQIRALKMSEDEIKGKYELLINEEKALGEKRIANILKMQENLHSKSEVHDILKGQLINCEQKLLLQIQNNSRLIENESQFQIKIEDQDKQIQRLKNQIDKNNNDHFINFGTQQELDIQRGQNFIDSKKTSKIISNLINEKQLLKAQLQRQREGNYISSSRVKYDDKQQKMTKDLLSEKNEEVKRILLELDKQKVENLNNKQKISTLTKHISALKAENSELKQVVEKYKIETCHQNMNDLSFEQNHNLEKSRSHSNRIQINKYEGQGIEGYPYYQMLSKEFKIRFKRACLREKELLYKQNGIEIGVITNFIELNQIQVVIHLTNYGEGVITNLKLKLMNSNENKASCQHAEFYQVHSNQQVKAKVNLVITCYPIGPLILCIDCTNGQKKEELRILLPTHIFKMIEVENRKKSINHSHSCELLFEKKIGKNLEELCQYFKIASCDGKSLKVSLFHKHTHTVTNVDIESHGDAFELFYEHDEGSLAISDYLVRTLCFLLSKR